MGDTRNDQTIDDCQEGRLAEFCLDHASVCAFMVDQEGRIRYANLKACDSLGYSQKELLNLSVFDIDSVANREKWPSLWQKLCDDGSTAFESRHHRKDGTVFPIEVTVTLVEFEGRRYSVALTKDVTERERLYESLRVTRFIFDKAPLGIFLIKDGGHIANVNEHACRYLGYTKEELCRMHVLDIDCGYSPQEIDQIWVRQQQKESIDTFETVHRRKDGSHIPVEVSGIVLDFDDVPYSVSFVKDISERKDSERQRLKMEAQIREVQRIESLGTLAGGIAHDFNNILAAILGYAELAQLECPVDSPLRSYVSEIAKAGHRARELVQQILLFSRQGRSEKGPLVVSQVVNEALKLIKATLPANIEILKNLSPDLPPVFANEIQIHQIVMNLCTNAYHAMKTTGGMLDVSLTAVSILDQDERSHPDMKPGSYIKLSIGDNGCGIAPETINRIFEPYFTTKPTGEGTGLGLSTVHGIIKDHGGFIKVYSEMGVGTTFHVFLPAAVTAEETAVMQPEQLPTGSECILLVDDEQALIDLSRDLLGRLGYRVETRASPIDAIEAFRANPQKYDLVISDMTMPKMTGDEMARQMKAIRLDIPIILCSGFSDRIHAQAMEAIGISAVLMKPVIYADLAHTVRRVLDACIISGGGNGVQLDEEISVTGLSSGVRDKTQPDRKLKELGWSEWFEERVQCESSDTIARVAAVDRDQLLVVDPTGGYRAKLAGSYRHRHHLPHELPCVGDWVCLRKPSGDDVGVVHALLERRTSLRRKSAGNVIEYQMIAANVDLVVIVQSCHVDFNLKRLDRYLAMVMDGGAEPYVLLTKTDLVDPAVLAAQRAQIRSAGITAPIGALSNLTGDGVDDLKARLLPGKTYCFVGSSGVGKSTLINRLIGREMLETKAVSATGEGRHTTVRRELIRLEGGALVIDNPGMREFGLLGAEGGLGNCYSAIPALASGCRYRDCSHTGEPGCAVLDAVRSGQISREHLESFLKLREESERYQMSYAEKRKKDRDFGRYLKSAKKDLRKE